MWCSVCYQDVPGARHSTTGRLLCSHCQQPMQTRKTTQPTRICDEGLALDERAAAVAAAAAPFRNDDWAARQRVRNLGRELRRPNFTATSNASIGPSRLDPPQDLFAQLQQATAPGITSITPQPAPVALRSRRADGSQIVAWFVVLCGALALAAGIGLIAWSLAAKQMVYWDLALGLTLGGQGTLILGLVLVVSRLWRNSRFASGKLQDVHARIVQLQSTADALTTIRAGGSAPAFYADLVRGASPQVLLANLKGQLDQLATRVGSGW